MIVAIVILSNNPPVSAVSTLLPRLTSHWTGPVHKSQTCLSILFFDNS